MIYQVQLLQVAPQLTAAVRLKATAYQLSTVIPQACGEVWDFVRAAELPRPGRHVALYLDCEMNIECGAEVFAPFVGNDRVVCSRLPEGTAATTVHFGPYGSLGQAHDAVRTWCADHGYTLTGPSWEVYGHWTDDPTQLRTDIFYLVNTVV